MNICQLLRVNCFVQLVESLVSMYKKCYSETIPAAKIKVATAFLKAGVLLAKIWIYWRRVHSLSGSQHLRDFFPPYIQEIFIWQTCIHYF